MFLVPLSDILLRSKQDFPRAISTAVDALTRSDILRSFRFHKVSFCRQGAPLSKKSRSPGVKPEITEAPQNTDLRVALWLGLALFFFYLLTTSAHQPYGDEEEYLAVAENLLTQGTLTIMRAEPADDGKVRNGLNYSKFSLGQNVLLLPFAAVELAARALLPSGFSFLPTMIVNALPALESAAICALLFLLIQVIGNIRPELLLSQRTALTLTLLAGVATQLWPASRTLFADNSIALLLTFSIYALVRFAHTRAGASWLIAAAGSAAMMVLCKNLLIMACPGLLAYGYWAVRERRLSRNERRRLAGAAALLFLAAAALQLWYNDLRYGSIWSSGYHADRDGEFGFSTPLLVGLYGIFLSSGRSLFLYSPVCVLAFLGARDFFRYAQAESALIAGVALSVVFAYAKWWSWHGGWEWGARFYLFLIPLLILASVPAWRWLDQPTAPLARRVRLCALAAFLIVSIGIQGLGLLIHPAAYWFIVAKEIKLHDQAVYQKGVWEIRDDMLQPHFVPEFSPVAAHAWLVWATWNRDQLDDKALAEAAPWFSLNSKWAPKNVRPYLGFDLWFLGNQPTGAPLLAAVTLIVALCFCGLRLKSAVTLPRQSSSLRFRPG